MRFSTTVLMGEHGQINRPMDNSISALQTCFKSVNTPGTWMSTNSIDLKHDLHRPSRTVSCPEPPVQREHGPAILTETICGHNVSWMPETNYSSWDCVLCTLQSECRVGSVLPMFMHRAEHRFSYPEASYMSTCPITSAPYNVHWAHKKAVQ